jgi:hypothetical protein
VDTFAENVAGETGIVWRTWDDGVFKGSGVQYFRELVFVSAWTAM